MLRIVVLQCEQNSAMKSSMTADDVEQLQLRAQSQ